MWTSPINWLSRCFIMMQVCSIKNSHRSDKSSQKLVLLAPCSLNIIRGIAVQLERFNSDGTMLALPAPHQIGTRQALRQRPGSEQRVVFWPTQASLP